MRLDEGHPLNERVLKHLKDPRRLRPGTEPIIAPDAHPNPYMGAGSHPDVVERLWKVLGSSLPVDCRALVYGTPALVHPARGVVFGLGYGTQYAIRIPDELLQRALELGCTTVQVWAGGRTTNIEEELGYGWVFGHWLREESQWLVQTYEELSEPSSHE